MRDPRAQLLAVVLVGLLLRSLFFVGFALGDDLGYIGHATQILQGGYPPLEPLNQYAYRPLLLYLFSAGIALFGFTDVGIVAPVLLASLATIVIVHAFVRRFVDSSAALWCAVLLAFQPFNVVNSTTMTNDVILSCLVFGAVALFLVADAESSPNRMRRLFVAAAVVMTGAFLVKMTLAPVLFALGLYSLFSCKARWSTVLGGHVVFYLAFLIGLACICGVYYLKTGDPLWQFRSELQYYQTYKPDWYLQGKINYSNLLWEYPLSLFGRSGYGPFRYFEQGLLFWVFVPAAGWAVATRNRILSFLVMTALSVFLFFQFYPQYLFPRYLPLVRQTRYLEMLLPAVVIVVGSALHRVWRQHRVVGTIVLLVLVGDFVYEASRRALLFDDSQQDMRALAAYADSTIAQTGAPLAVDMPADASLQFYLRGVALARVPIAQQPLEGAYVAVGGARGFWWSRDLVFDPPPGEIPAHWVLAYTAPGRKVPWRPSELRVFYVGPHSHIFITPLNEGRAGCQPGLRQLPFPGGFGAPSSTGADVQSIPEIAADTPIPAAQLEWTGSFRADDDVYTFETTSDDGSWIWLNDQLVLDNGGTHPAKIGRRTVRLGRGRYAFKLRYEDTGGVRFLRFRIYRGEGRSPFPDTPVFCVDTLAGGGSGSDSR